MILKTATLEIVVRPFTTQGGMTIYTRDNAGENFGYISSTFNKSAADAVLLRYLALGYKVIGQNLDALEREPRPGIFAFRQSDSLIWVTERERSIVHLPNGFFEQIDGARAYELSDVLSRMADAIVGADAASELVSA